MSLRTAVIGGGAVSEVHLTGLARNPRTDLVAICDVDDETARELALKYDIMPYTDTTELLASEALDWIHLCTPVRTHYPLAREIIEAGVPLLIEKPVTDTAEEAAALRDFAAEHDVPVSVVRNHLFTAAMRGARATIDGGDLGDLRAVEVTYAGNTWPDEPNRGAWTFDLAGGEFEEGIPHPLYVMLATGGYPESVEGVHAVTNRHRSYEQGFEYDGLKISYATDGGTLCGTTVLAGAVPQRTVDIHGSDRSLRVDLISGTTLRIERDYKASPVARLRNDVDRAIGRLGGVVSNVRGAIRARRSDDWTTTRNRNPHFYQFDREIDGLLTDGEPAVPLENAVWTLRLMETVREDARGRVDGSDTTAQESPEQAPEQS